MRKIICSVLIVIQIMMLANVNAAVGEVIGCACQTDIIATIAGAQIPSFNVNGNTYIIAEDLADYGFNVVWHPDDRLISITRNHSARNIYTGYAKPYVSPEEIGVPVYDILSTDINASINGFYLGKYINGTPLFAYNINGRTIIPFDALAIFGNVRWNGDKREISLDIPGINNILTGMMSPEAVYNEASAFAENLMNISSGITAQNLSEAEMLPFSNYMYCTSDALLTELLGYMEQDAVISKLYKRKGFKSTGEMSAKLNSIQNQAQIEVTARMNVTKASSGNKPYQVYIAGAVANLEICEKLSELLIY